MRAIIGTRSAFRTILTRLPLKSTSLQCAATGRLAKRPSGTSSMGEERALLALRLNKEPDLEGFRPKIQAARSGESTRRAWGTRTTCSWTGGRQSQTTHI
jgi:hypothetical protein